MKTIATLRGWVRLAAVCLAPLSLLAASVPAGTQLRIRMIDSLDSGTARAGDTFRATLDKPLIADGQILFPKGTNVTGQVLEARPSAGSGGPGVLQLRVVAIDIGDASYNVKARPYGLKGEWRARSNLLKIGSGAGASTLMGVSLGSASVPPSTGPKEARIESESVLIFVTAAEMNVPASAARRAGRPHN